MKLIEVVFLAGTHCVSPIQHAPPLTEVFKVQCAVVVTADTETDTISVVPETEAGNPLVIAAMGHLQALAEPLPVPEPAAGPVPRPATNPEAEASDFKARPEVIATNLIAAEPLAEPVAAAEEVEAPSPRKPAAAASAAKKPKAKRKKSASQCSGAARAVWYTNKDGKRKYRCQRGANKQLY